MNSILEYKKYFIRATENAAIACAQLRGCNDKNKADQAAVNGMRVTLMDSPVDVRVAIGEGEIDEAPMLYIGEKLGTKIKFAQIDANTYKLFVSAGGDKTELNEGRIYIFDKNSTDDFVLSNDNDYRGTYSTASTYFVNDLVRVGETIYKAKTNTVPGAFNLNLWDTVNSGVDLLGYVPNDTNFSITESTLEQKVREPILSHNSLDPKKL